MTVGRPRITRRRVRCQRVVRGIIEVDARVTRGAPRRVRRECIAVRGTREVEAPLVPRRHVRCKRVVGGFAQLEAERAPRHRVRRERVERATLDVDGLFFRRARVRCERIVVAGIVEVDAIPPVRRRPVRRKRVPGRARLEIDAHAVVIHLDALDGGRIDILKKDAGIPSRDAQITDRDPRLRAGVNRPEFCLAVDAEFDDRRDRILADDPDGRNGDRDRVGLGKDPGIDVDRVSGHQQVIDRCQRPAR